MKHKKLIVEGILLLLVLLKFDAQYAQQDPQYTQYMYNTMSVNPGYAGQRETLSIMGLYRAQWVGIEGSPDTQTLSVHSPLRNEKVGLGLSIVNDNLGPASEVFADANFSYTLPLDSNYTALSFGLKVGFHQLKTDWSKGSFKDPDSAFSQNISLFSPSIGVGLYLHSRKWYLGVSMPNVINTKHYDDDVESLATEKIHFYLIGGYVFDLDRRLQLKPSFFVKAVAGSPIIADVSANLWFNRKMTLGLAWRWDDSVSALIGFELSNELFLGYSYDKTTTGLKNYNSGSHEITLRFELMNKSKRMLSPRFF